MEIFTPYREFGVIAGVGCRIDAVGQTDIDHTLMYIRDFARILALDATFFRLSWLVFWDTKNRLWASMIHSQAKSSRAMIEHSTTKTSTRMTSFATTITWAWTDSMLPGILFWHSSSSLYSCPERLKEIKIKYP